MRIIDDDYDPQPGIPLFCGPAFPKIISATVEYVIRCNAGAMGCGMADDAVAEVDSSAGPLALKSVAELSIALIDLISNNHRINLSAEADSDAIDNALQPAKKIA